MWIKVLSLHFFLSKIYEWYWSSDRNDLGILKLLLLLYLTSSSNYKLLNVFDNFELRKCWIIEKDTYDYILHCDWVLWNYIITNYKTTFDNSTINSNYMPHKDVQTIIQESINNIKMYNEKLILYSVSDLVDLVKKQDSWWLCNQFEIRKIHTKLITNSVKYYN